jgi:hypothetical protein
MATHERRGRAAGSCTPERNVGAARVPTAPWGGARSVASEQISSFRDELRVALADTADLLVIEPVTNSDSWREAGERLQRACSRVGWAVYCLREWAEPDDSRADIAPDRYRGRRSYRRW